MSSWVTLEGEGVTGLGSVGIEGVGLLGVVRNLGAQFVPGTV